MGPTPGWGPTAATRRRLRSTRSGPSTLRRARTLSGSSKPATPGSTPGRRTTSSSRSGTLLLQGGCWLPARPHKPQLRAFDSRPCNHDGSPQKHARAGCAGPSRRFVQRPPRTARRSAQRAARAARGAGTAAPPADPDPDLLSLVGEFDSRRGHPRCRAWTRPGPPKPGLGGSIPPGSTRSTLASTNGQVSRLSLCLCGFSSRREPHLCYPPVHDRRDSRRRRRPGRPGPRARAARHLRQARRTEGSLASRSSISLLAW